VFQSEILFKSGSANIEISGKEALSSVSILILDLIEEIPSNLNWVLQVDGHTDKIPIYTQEFPSNWELSHARALEVVKFFISQGIPSKRLSANGYGDNQPIVFGDSPDELKLNRRIELKITQR
jgi:chemotaxis protein MotB